MIEQRRVLSFLFIVVILSRLPACGIAGGEEDSAEETVLIYANLTAEGANRALVSRFNAAHRGKVRIEVRDYLDEDGSSGKTRLLAEIAAGQAPDILDTRSLPLRALGQKGYWEHLWPYIEKDPALGRDGVMENILETALDG